jgi:hypothetical protein
MGMIRIREAAALDGFRLGLRLTNGERVERDVVLLLEGPVFEPLKKDPALFRDLHVEAGTVVWSNGADLCPDLLIWGGPPPEDGEARSVPQTLVLGATTTA